jgi:N4-gp56 family major capsid protein
MATYAIGVNSNEAVKLWSRKLAHEAFKTTYFQRFVGDTSDSLVQELKDAQKGPGDRIRVILRVLLTGDGVVGDQPMEGNEEALTTYTFDFLINQLRHAVRSQGKMSEQRIPFSVREEAMNGLRDWWAERYDLCFFNQICGNTAETRLNYIGNNATVAPTRQMWVGAVANDQSLGSTNTMTLQTLDFAYEKVTATPISAGLPGGIPMLRPIMVDGEPYYVVFLHPYQVTDLRTNTNTGQWLDIQKAAMTGGVVEKNPIFTGALGVYNNMVLHKAFRCTLGVNSATNAAVASTRRAVLCGAQAVTLGFGQGHSRNQMEWNEELFDYGNQLGVEGGAIFGLNKTTFNSVDFGCMVISSWAAAHA